MKDPRQKLERIVGKQRAGREERQAGGVPNPGSPNISARVLPRKESRKGPHNQGVSDIALRDDDGTFEDLEMDQEAIIEDIQFILINKNRPNEFKEHESKGRILETVEYLISLSIGGWHSEGDLYINESGRVACKENWILEDGKLSHRSGLMLNDSEWLHKIKDVLGS